MAKIEKTDNGFVAIVSPGNGLAEQKFYGATYEDVMGKLIVAQENASRKINEQKLLLKTGPGQQPDPARTMREFKPAALSAEQRRSLEKQLSDPATAPSAIKSLLEAELGAPLDVVRASLNDVEQQKFREQAMREGAQFQQEHPDYLPTPRNEKVLLDYLGSHNMAFTARNIALAYEDLKASELLELKQPSTVSEPIEDQPNVERRPRLASTGIHGARSATGTAPRPRSPRLTAEELHNMPADEYRRKFSDPDFRKAVDELQVR